MYRLSTIQITIVSTEIVINWSKMSEVTHFMFVTVFLSLIVTSSYSCAPVSDQKTVENKTTEFYCASIKLKNIINDLIQVISLCSCNKHVFE